MLENACPSASHETVPINMFLHYRRPFTQLVTVPELLPYDNGYNYHDSYVYIINKETVYKSGICQVYSVCISSAIVNAVCNPQDFVSMVIALPVIVL